jgi:competence ComEA-like helix-hairpin-helix protein
MMKRISEWLVLTKTEQKVILFLVITLLAGAGIQLYQKTFASAPHFDYQATDSTFTTLSTAPEDTIGQSVKETAKEVYDKLNINTATKQQLMDLPGIGEATAERILQYRIENGKFAEINGLREIKGMSAKKLEKLKPLITIQ